MRSEYDFRMENGFMERQEEVLINVRSASELNEKIGEWNQIIVSNSEEVDDETPVVLGFVKRRKKLPGAGWQCPICANGVRFKDGNSWRGHIDKKHPEVIKAQHAIMWLSTLKERVG